MNDASFKFLIIDKEQCGGKMLDIRLYDRSDCVWKSFSFPEMQEVRLAVTPTSNSISVRWTKPLSSSYSSNYFSGFSEFILQHRVNVGIAGWLNPFLSSDPLAASVEYHQL